MIARSASYSSSDSSPSFPNICRSSSSCGSLQTTSQASSSENLSLHNNAQKSHLGPTISSLAISLGKQIVCKGLQSTYSIHSSSSTSNNGDKAKSKDSNPISSNPWLQLTLICLVSMKLHLLFEHSVCLLSLVATRYLAGKKRERHFVNGDDNIAAGSQIHLVRTASSSSDQDGIFNGSGVGCMASSNLPPSAIELSEDSQHSTASASQTWSQKDLEALSAPSPPSHANGEDTITTSFLPSSMDTATDEWGQFTDFDDGYRNESLFLGDEGTTPSTSVIPEDPYRSISKAILKRRGDKLSVCKLGQLQEEENEDDFD